MRYEFKAKTAENGEWVYGGIAEVFGKTCIVTKNGDIIPVAPYSVCRWVEKVDKTGKKIYEDDYIRVKIPEESDHYFDKDEEYMFFKVDENDVGSFASVVYPDVGIKFGFAYIARTGEVVGNWNDVLFNYKNEEEFFEKCRRTEALLNKKSATRRLRK